MAMRHSFLIPLGTAILSVLSGAAASELLVPNAVAQVARGRDDEDTTALLLIESASGRDTVFVLDPRLHRFAKKSISDWKNAYVEECDGCAKRAECGGFFASGIRRKSRGILAMQTSAGRSRER